MDQTKGLSSLALCFHSDQPDSHNQDMKTMYFITHDPYDLLVETI